MNVDSGRGAITGFPLAGRVNGPISHGCGSLRLQRQLRKPAQAANTQPRFMPRLDL